jgi:2-polyprenyl-6-methoxyphenol hydroxylase-like FAD-dependent oxidoreductase
MINNERTEVLVVGAGPVGLTMAAELARHGVRPRIIDRMRAPSPYCRAIGVSPRTLEVLDDMGIARQLIDAGVWLEGTRNIVNGKIIDELRDLSDLPYSPLGVAQYDTERVLTRHLSMLGVEIERGVSLLGLTQSDGQVQAVVADSQSRQSNPSFRYVIGCDGAHSAVRRALGIAFEGDAFPYEFILGDVHIDWNLPRGMMLRVLRPVPNAVPEFFIAIPLAEAHRYRVTMIAPPEIFAPSGGTDHGIQSERAAPGIEHLQAVADSLLPEKAVLGDLRWSSVFRISMRLAASYRMGNVFIAGDAAHIHPPTGGQGMNTGIQDAYNLAWKLALVMRGRADASLLNSYEIERRAVGKEVVESTTQASVNLGRERAAPDRLEGTQLLVSYRDSASLKNTPAADGPTTGPVTGDRVPDCHNLIRAGFGFPLRLFDILRGIDHVLIASCPDQSSMQSLAELTSLLRQLGVSDLLRVVAVAPAGKRWGVPPQLPVYIDSAGEFGSIFGAATVVLLIRPDGYLAWRGQDCRESGLANYLTRVFLPLTKQPSA